MSLKDQYIVRKLSTKEYVEWFTQKHYAKRIPSVSYAYGLYKNKFIIYAKIIGRYYIEVSTGLSVEFANHFSWFFMTF